VTDLLYGVFFVLLGLPLAMDYRGVVSEQVALQKQSLLRRLPPWRWLNRNEAKTARRQMLVARLVGSGFVVLGMVEILVGTIRLITAR
jgi:hypothetical protein